MKKSDAMDAIQNVAECAECLHDFNAIERALDNMADAMTQTLKDHCPLILCVMMGALVVVGHLLPRLRFPLELDYIHVTRYHGTTRSGDLHWLVQPRYSLKNRTIVIVDDVMDSGLTLGAIMDYCRQAGASHVYTAVLVNKFATRAAGIDFVPDFIGLHTDDRFIFGFGLDYREYLRNMPGIYAVSEGKL